MAQIIVTLNNQTIKRIKLVKPSYLIGRSNQCDIVLPERTISSFHAKLINAGEDCFLEDTNSTNGTFVNNNVISKHLLIDNDIINVGKYQLTFRSAVGLVTQLRQLSVHPTLKADQAYPWLEINSGKKRGHIIPLERTKVTLGGHEISKVTIERNQKGDYLLHTINRNQVKEVRKLHSEDVFLVGDVELVFHTEKETATL